MTKRKIESVDLDHYQKINEDRRNLLLLDWLGDDDRRGELFSALNGKPLVFPSRDTSPREPAGLGPGSEWPVPNVGHKLVRLVTDPCSIKEILGDDGSKYSNRVYAELGGGNFMLALDPSVSLAHGLQRKAFACAFSNSDETLLKLAFEAVRAASIMSLLTPEFDMAAFAEEAALRYCQKLMGYSMSDYPILEASLRSAYRALVYQVMGRHFATNPLAIPVARQQMGALLARTSDLIDAYARNDKDALKGCKDRELPDGLIPSLKRLGKLDSEINGEQRAIVALGAAIGTVGNVQAAACIVMKAYFSDSGKELRGEIDALATKTKTKPRNSLDRNEFEDWKGAIAPSLAENPPIPFLPRWDVVSGEEVILALGAATRDAASAASLVWGGDPGTHHCAGEALAWPLIVEIVRQTCRLPSLAQGLDAQDGAPVGLTKTWGFICESYPLRHRRESRVAQTTLNVHMRLRPPVRDSADRVREIIRSGAPRIEEALRSATHVHFAWFELIEADTVLVLHTVYDGPFSAYIQQFALMVGDLFDVLFSCIEDAPPTPIDKFPDEFVALIQRYNRPPAMGYFFSAYPRSEVTQILRDDRVRS